MRFPKPLPRQLTLILLALAAGSANGLAAPPAKRPPPSVATPTPQVLWDHWFVVTVGKDSHWQYYQERVERIQGRIRFQMNLWRQEEGFINEEQLSAFAKDDEELTPLFFNFHQTYRTTDLTIDGTIGDKRMLTVSARRGTNPLPVIKRFIPPKTIFSQHFPIWLGRKLKDLKADRSVSFLTVLEDQLEKEYTTVPGTLRLEAADDFAKKNQAQKILVDYLDRKSTWWVDAKGAALRVEIPGPLPGQKTVVERADEATARAFLNLAKGSSASSPNTSGEE